MFKFINSQVIPNFYIRILILVSIIAISTYIREKSFRKKSGLHGWPGLEDKDFHLNYFIHIIIFFVIPIFFQIDNFLVSTIIKYVGMIYNFVFSIMHISLFVPNIFLTPFLILLF